mmetsp:Transcript_71562/g.125952  ORF Transcript_71562/g.125952 Transcript_71562/m.125952 type:complete len:263 (+) Transcript_71562:255-1043(+)
MTSFLRNHGMVHGGLYRPRVYLIPPSLVLATSYPLASAMSATRRARFSVSRGLVVPAYRSTATRRSGMATRCTSLLVGSGASLIDLYSEGRINCMALRAPFSSVITGAVIAIVLPSSFVTTGAVIAMACVFLLAGSPKTPMYWAKRRNPESSAESIKVSTATPSGYFRSSTFSFVQLSSMLYFGVSTSIFPRILPRLLSRLRLCAALCGCSPEPFCPSSSSTAIMTRLMTTVQFVLEYRWAWIGSILDSSRAAASVGSMLPS